MNIELTEREISKIIRSLKITDSLESIISYASGDERKTTKSCIEKLEKLETHEIYWLSGFNGATHIIKKIKDLVKDA